MTTFSEDTLLQIIDESPAAMFVNDVDNEFRIILWNKAMEQLSGIPRQDVLGGNEYDLLPKDEADRFRQINEDIVANGETQYLNKQTASSSAPDTLVTAKKIPLTLSDGRPILLGIMEDVTNEVLSVRTIDKYKLEIESIPNSDASKHESFSSIDPLTGLSNRSAALYKINTHIDEISETPFSLLQINLDRFKLVNDSFGHAVGDFLLIQVSERLKKYSDTAPLIARMSGDEFLIGIYETSTFTVAEVASEIIQNIESPYQINGNNYEISCSVGISQYPLNAQNSNSLIQCCNTAVSEAKQNKGEMKVVFFTPIMHATAMRKSALEQALRHSIENNELEVHYQPQFSIKEDQKIEGLEALVRWNSKDYGSVSPVEFIPLAEEAGFIGMLGTWVLDTVCHQIKTWEKTLQSIPRISVNLSTKEIDFSLPTRVKDCLHKYNVKGENITLEITESKTFDQGDHIFSIFKNLRDIGINISIDDFGTGYSSLSYLNRLSFDELKIDRSFIKNVPNSKKETQLLQAIITMGNLLNCRVVMEGIETKDQLKTMEAMKCHIVQGYLTGRPANHETTLELLKTANF